MCCLQEMGDTAVDDEEEVRCFIILRRSMFCDSDADPDSRKKTTPQRALERTPLGGTCCGLSNCEPFCA